MSEGEDTAASGPKRSRTRNAAKAVERPPASEKSQPSAEGKQVRKRVVRNFPNGTFSEALEFAKSVYDAGSGGPVKRLTFFNLIDKSPDSGPSRALVTNSGKYGLTRGGYQAEELEPTPLAIRIFNESNSPRDREKAKIESAVTSIGPFNGVYEALIGNKLPATSVIEDRIKAFEVSPDVATEAVNTLIVNLRDVGLLKTLSGAERVVSIDTHLDELPASTPKTVAVETTTNIGLSDLHSVLPLAGAVITAGRAEYETTAFYITPIGEESSDTRKHADLFASSIVEPALEQFKLRLLRADQIEAPGIITRQILDYIIHSRLVIADLSFHNPNVFYELAIRHIMRKPTVQIMRARDRIPFDISQSRTIKIDDGDLYTFVPKIPVHIASVSAQVRQALENPDAGDNPISIYYPRLMGTEQAT